MLHSKTATAHKMDISKQKETKRKQRNPSARELMPQTSSAKRNPTNDEDEEDDEISRRRRVSWWRKIQYAIAVNMVKIHSELKQIGSVLAANTKTVWFLLLIFLLKYNLKFKSRNLNEWLQNKMVK